MKVKSDNPPRVLVIILNWNNAPDTINCIRSLKRIDYPNYEIVLIDNGSTDNSVGEIRRAFPEVGIVENGRNLGVAGGRNVGIEIALNRIRGGGDDAPEYVLFLDNDTVVDRGFITEMIAAHRSDPSIGVLTSKIYYLGDPDRIWAAGGRLRFSQCKVYIRGEGERDSGQYDEISDIDWALGSVFLVTRMALEDVGKFDPAFGVYCGEEVDWCIRARKLGYRIVYVPKSKVWHRVSKTVPGANYWYQKVRNHLIIMRRHASLTQWLTFLSLFGFIALRAIVRQIAYGRSGNIVHMFRGGLASLASPGVGRWASSIRRGGTDKVPKEITGR